MSKLSRTPGRLAQRGMSLVELMVGMVVAMVTVLAITQIMVASEAYKRTTTGGSDALQNGAFAQLMLERYIRMGASNFATIANVFGCALNVYRDGSLVVGGESHTDYPEPFKTNLDFVPLLAPVIVKQGDSGASDTIVVFAGQHPSIAKSLSPSIIGGGSASTVSFASKTGINSSLGADGSPLRDLLLAVDQDRTAGSDSCDVAEAVSLASSGATVNLTGSGMKYTGLDAFNLYSKSAVVADLGPNPLFLAFAVGSDGHTTNSLLAYDYLAGNSQSLSDGIVAIKALYGIASSPKSSVVSSWVAPSGDVWAADKLNAGSIILMRALRLAVLARNSQREKEQVSPASLTVFEDAKDSKDASLAISISVPDRHYRYKVFDVTIPLRQMVIMAKN